MPNNIDRGLLVVHDEADGTTSLSICAKVVHGAPTDVYAKYNHASQVSIDGDVHLTRQGHSRYTHEIVEVINEGQAGITVRYPRYDEHPPA